MLALMIGAPLGLSAVTEIDEDFSSGASSFSVISGGAWGVSSGRYVLSSPGSAGNGLLGNISVHNTSVSGDQTITALVRITGTGSAWDDTALVFNYQDSSNYCYVSLNESNDQYTKGVFKVVSGTPTELADIGSSIASDTDYNLEIQRSGSSIVVLLNSSQIASTTDSTFSGGKIGFGSKNDGGQFDNLLVTTPGSGGGGEVTLDALDGFYNDALTTAQTGTFTAEFDATPSSNGMDVAMGLSPSSATWYSDMAVIIRFNTSGDIDARDGGTYTADNTISYSGGTSYHFRLAVDVSNHTFSAYVTPSGGSEQTIATGYDFRTEQASASSIGYWTATVESSSVGSVDLDNFAITGTGGGQVSAPVFNPGSGTYSSAQSVTITTSTSGASIRYTTDGSTPTSTTGTVYGTPVSISSNATLKAIAYKSGMTDSSVTTGTYIIGGGTNQTYQAEDYSSISGCAASTQHAGYTGTGFVDFGGNGTWMEWNNINTGGSGSVTLDFRYANGLSPNRQCALTVNGVSQGNVAFAPTGAWTTWGTASATVALNAGNNTIRLTANTSNGGPNLDKVDVIVSGGGGTVISPQFSPGGGSYGSAQNVTITTSTSGATIRYTTDGSVPTSTTGTVYSGPVSVSSSLTLRAIAYKSGMTDSAVTSATYTIGGGGGNPYPSPGTVGFTGSEGSLTVINATNGYYRIDSTNATLSNVYVKGHVDFYGSGTLTITNSVIEGGYGSWGIVTGRTTGATMNISDSTLRWKAGASPGTSSGVIGVLGNVKIIAYRNDLSGAPDGIQMNTSGTEIVNNYFHNLSMVGSPPNNTHNDGIQIFAGTNITIRGNYFNVGAVSPYSNGVIFAQGCGIGTVLVEDNYINGGGYQLPIQAGQFTVRDNVFGPNKLFGVYYTRNCGSISSWTGNIAGDSSGNPISPPQPVGP